MMKTVFSISLICAGALLVAPAARAQSGGAPPAARAGIAKPLSYVLTQMKKSSGSAVLCATSLATLPVAMPRDPASPETLESQLDILVKALPKGTIWAKLMLPTPAAGKQFKGDDLAAYAIAQARLFGTIGGAEAGTVEVLSRKLPSEAAAPVVQALGLQPIYVLCNPSSTPGVASDFTALNDAEKQVWAEKQAQQLLSLPAEQQIQAMGQMFQQAGLVFGNMMKSMSPEQRRGLFQNLGSMMGSMGGPGGLFGPGGGR